MAIKHSITLSTTEPNNEVGVIKIRQADEQTQILDVQITADGVPMSFVGYQPFFCAKLGQTAGLGIVEQKITGTMNPANGTLEYVMRQEDWQKVGRQIGYFAFRKMKNDHEWTEQFTTRDFTYNVIPSVTGEIREVKKDGSTYVWTIENMLRLFKEYIATGKVEWENYKNDERTIWENYRLAEKINWDDYKLREKNEWKNYKDDEKAVWEKFVEDNREFLETADPGGKIILELLGARGGAQTLGERLDGEKAEVSAQLAQNVGNTMFKKDSTLTKIIYPTEVQSHKLPINIYNQQGKFRTDFDAKSLKPTRTNTYYVNPARGDDSNDGSDFSNSFKSIKKALEMPGDNEIILASGEYYYKDGWQGYDPAKGINVICKTGKAKLTNSAYKRRWVESDTYPGMYSAPTEYNGENLQTEYPDIRFIVKGYDDLGVSGTQLATKTVANLQNGQAGFIIGTTSTSVRLPNNLDPNEYLDIKYAKDNIVDKINNLTDAKIYMENIDAFYGNVNTIQLETSTNYSEIILINVGGHEARTGDGIYLDANGLAVLWGCEAHKNYEDGINYYVNTSVSGMTRFDIIEVECKANFNGRSNSGANNGTTLHGTAKAIRLNGDFDNNQDRNVHDVGGGWSFNVGCRARFSQNNLEDFASGHPTAGYNEKMWLVGCDAGKVSALIDSQLFKETDVTFGEELATGTATINEFNAY